MEMIQSNFRLVSHSLFQCLRYLEFNDEVNQISGRCYLSAVQGHDVTDAMIRVHNGRQVLWEGEQFNDDNLHHLTSTYSH